MNIKKPVIFLCVCVCVCTRTHVYHVFFIHLFVSGHLGCFHTLAIVNKGCNEYGSTDISLR